MKKTCLTCQHVGTDVPVCWVTGVPMEVGENYVCPNWSGSVLYPPKEADSDAGEPAAADSTVTD